MIDITIQETVNDVEITVNQTVITVNVTRTTGGGGGGVESVTGDLVDNTDPLNPIINTPSFAQTLAVDNKTNNIHIISNNGLARVKLNDDYVQIEYENNLITLSLIDGLQLYSDTGVLTLAPVMSAIIDTAISYTCTSFTLNSEEVATQPWVTSQGYGTGTVTSVMGDLVDNTDPLNPVVETPNLTQVLAIDNKTNDIPIISNNGSAVVYVNDDYVTLTYGIQSFAMTDDYVSLTYGSQSFDMTEDGVQLYSDVPVAFDSTVSTDFNTPVLNYNDEEVATQPYADAKVANDLTASTTVAPSKTAVNTALDFTRRLITKGTGSVTGTVSETILTTLTIPANTLDSSCFIWTTMDFFKTNSGAVTTRLYINNANTLTGATLLGFFTLGSNRNVSFNRKFLVTGTSLDLLTTDTALTQVTNEFIGALFGASTVLTINPSADIFLIYTTQNDATGTVATNKMATVQKMKL